MDGSTLKMVDILGYQENLKIEMMDEMEMKMEETKKKYKKLLRKKFKNP